MLRITNTLIGPIICDPTHPRQDGDMISGRYCMGGGVRDLDYGLVMGLYDSGDPDIIHAYLKTPRCPPPEAFFSSLHHPSTSTKSQIRNLNHKTYLPRTHVTNPPITKMQPCTCASCSSCSGNCSNCGCGSCGVSLSQSFFGRTTLTCCSTEPTADRTGGRCGD